MNEVDRIGKYSGLLSVAEAGLGSLLHAYHIPLAGHLLSLNQGFLLSRYVDESDESSVWSPYKISLMAAAVKSLSPMGKRLTPMLAISIQGLLFSFGLFIFGTNLLGAMLGIFLLSLWAFIQPALIFYIIFGNDLVQIFEFYNQEAQKIFQFDIIYLAYFFAALILVKILLAEVLAWLAFSAQKHNVENKINKLSQIEVLKPKPNQPIPVGFLAKLRLIGKDLLQPWFVFSLVLSFLFFYLTSPLSVKLVWYLLRPIAIAGILFYIKRFYSTDQFRRHLEFIRGSFRS